MEVWPEHEATVCAFLACATQWRRAGLAGVRTGLDYAAVDAVLRLTVPRPARATVFAGIQIMEQAALAVFAELRE